MKMTEQEIKEAAEAIIKLRTRRESPPSDTDRYQKRTQIDALLADLKLSREIAGSYPRPIAPTS